METSRETGQNPEIENEKEKETKEKDFRKLRGEILRRMDIIGIAREMVVEGLSDEELKSRIMRNEVKRNEILADARKVIYDYEYNDKGKKIRKAEDDPEAFENYLKEHEESLDEQHKDSYKEQEKLEKERSESEK